MYMKRLFLLLAVFFLFNSSGTPVVKEETLLGAELNYESKSITLIVVSKGCTVKQDFVLHMQADKLLVTRKKNDDCKMMPFAERLTWTFKEAGINADKAFYIQNRFAGNPFTAIISK